MTKEEMKDAIDAALDILESTEEEMSVCLSQGEKVTTEHVKNLSDAVDILYGALSA